MRVCDLQLGSLADGHMYGLFGYGLDADAAHRSSALEFGSHPAKDGCTRIQGGRLLSHRHRRRDFRRCRAGSRFVGPLRLVSTSRARRMSVQICLRVGAAMPIRHKSSQVRQSESNRRLARTMLARRGPGPGRALCRRSNTVPAPSRPNSQSPCGCENRGTRPRAPATSHRSRRSPSTVPMQRSLPLPVRHCRRPYPGATISLLHAQWRNARPRLRRSACAREPAAPKDARSPGELTAEMPYRMRSSLRQIAPRNPCFQD